MCKKGFFLLFVVIVSACGGGGQQYSASSSSSEASSSSSSSSSEALEVSTETTGQGTVTPSQIQLEPGAVAEFTVQPDPGYSVESITGCPGQLEAMIFTVGALQSSCELSVTFSMNALASPSLSVQYQTNRRLLFSWESTGNAYYKLIEIDSLGVEHIVDERIDFDRDRLVKDIFILDQLGSAYQLLSCTGEVCAASEQVEPEGEAAASVQVLQQDEKDGYSKSAFGQHALIGESSGNIYAPSYYINESYIGYLPSDLVIFSERESNELHSVQRIETASIDGLAIDSAEKNIFLALAPSLSSAIGESYLSWYKSDGDEFFPPEAQLSDLNRRIRSISVSADGGLLALGVDSFSGDLNELPEVWLYSVGDELSFVTSLAPEVLDAQDEFGASIAMSANGDVLVVGAPGEDSARIDGEISPHDNSQNQAGAVYVFEQNGDIWSQTAMLKSPNPRGRWWDCYMEDCAKLHRPDDASGDSFGASVSVSADGRLVVVGAPLDDQGKGSVHIFRASSTWEHQESLQLNHADSKSWISPTEHMGGDNFGYSVSMSGDGQYLAVGAPYEESEATGLQGNSADNSRPNSGAAMLYKLGPVGVQSSTYIKSNDPDSLFFGVSVDISEGGGRSMVVSDRAGVHVY